MRRKIKAGALGPRGTFGELAAEKFIKEGIADEIIFFEDHSDIIEAVIDKSVDIGIVACENMIHGTVMDVLDKIYESDAAISAETDVAVELVLAGKNKGSLIKEVYSHPAALDQARQFIKKEYPDARQIPAKSTADAMRLAANSQDSAAIGTKSSALDNRLDIIKENIEDFEKNSTRFFAVSLHDLRKDDAKDYKTMIAVRDDEDRPGLLIDMLTPFAKNNVNLTKLESRPTKEKLGSYIFFIEMDGHRDDDAIKAALSEVRKAAADVKVLGSYHKI